MRTIRYCNYTIDTALFGRVYVPGDTLLAGWTGEIDHDTDRLAAVEAISERHNHPDCPDDQMCPSMSIGDVIVPSPSNRPGSGSAISTPPISMTPPRGSLDTRPVTDPQPVRGAPSHE